MAEAGRRHHGEAALSRRESKIVAIAGAVQAKSFDLTQYRQRSLAERRLKVRGEDAAGALAFAAMDQYEGLDGLPTGANDPDATRLPGDPLTPLLLRLKYADQWAKDSFQRAQLILLHRYGGLSGAPSETLFAVAYAALAEWVHDPCPKCRGTSAGTQEPALCLQCGQRRAEVGNGRWAIFGQPGAGCPKCGGLGRIFKEPKARRGMQCVACSNSGRVILHPKRRWRMVSEYLVAAQRARGERPRSLDYKTFLGYWQIRYERFLSVLRAADRRLVAGLELGLTARPRAEEDPGHEEVEQSP